MSSKTNSFNAFEQALASPLSAGATTLTLDSVLGLTAPGYLVIDPDIPGPGANSREWIRFAGISINDLTGLTRGLTGNPTQDVDHGNGARVRAVSVGQWLDDIFFDIDALELLQSDYLLLDGTRPMTGDLDLNGNELNQVGMAVAPLDADGVNFKYVNDQDDGVTAAYIAADLLLLDLAGTRPMTGPLQLAVGTEALPGLVFDGDATTGMYEQAATVIGWSVAGTEKMSLAPNGLRVGVQGDEGAFMWASNPSVANPSYAFDTDQNTGTYLKAAGVIGWAVNGAEAMSLGNGLRVGPSTDSAPFMRTGTPTQALPAYSFNGDTGTGVTRGSAGQVVISGLGVRRFSTSANAVLVGDAVVQGTPWMHPVAPSVTQPAYAFNGDANLGMYRSSNDVIGFAVGGVRKMALAATQFICPPIYDNLSGGGTAVHVNSSGIVFRSSSARKYKTDIEPLDGGLDVVRRLNPVAFASVLENDKGDRYVGFVAEDVAAEIPEAEVEENYDLRAVVAYLVKAVQELAPVEA